MRALLLAAGRGERMRPLTDTVAKPLLMAGGRRLVEWQIDALVRAGITQIVINTAHLAEQIEQTLGDGRRLGARIRYSREGTRAEDALETLGGIVRALPWLGDEPFVVASGDIVTDFDYRQLFSAAERLAGGAHDAHLVLVENPPYHPLGDMGLAVPGRAEPGRPGPRGAAPTGAHAALALRDKSGGAYTYANIGVFAPRLFAGLDARRAPLFPWLYAAVERGRVSAQLWHGPWWNVGTPHDLAEVNKVRS
jgi:MurNAc alpha-1-phosphate uridylyltransferase